MFKVLIREANKLYSGTKHCASVEYEEGKEIFPHPSLPNSKLFVFDNYDNAAEFKKVESSAHVWDYYEIWEVETTNPVRGYYKGFIFDGLECGKEFWKVLEKHEDKYWMYVNDAPEGTYWCDSLTLVKRVDV